MAATATSSASIGAQLRAGQISAVRDRVGRTGSGDFQGLSTLQPSAIPSSEGANPIIRMNQSRQAMNRFANPGGNMPNLQVTSETLREAGTGQESDADDIDQQMASVADENQQAQSMSLAARAKSRAKGATEDATKKTADMLKKKFEEFMAEAKAEAISKSGPVDEGEVLLLWNGSMTFISVVRSFLGIFSESMKKYNVLLNKLGIPIPNKLKVIGGAGTVGEFGLFCGLVMILFCLCIFLFYALGTANDAYQHPTGAAAAQLRRALLGI